MQGVVFMSQNPQQGSPPPNDSLDSDMTMEESSPDSNQIMTKEKLSSAAAAAANDSGIFSATSNTTMDVSTRTTSDDAAALSDNRSDCSSPPPTSERKYVCPICDTIQTSQHDFTLHIRSHNNENELQDNNEKGFTCRICFKILSSSSSLDRHVLVHSGERPFHCKFCGDTFTTNGNMHRHMRTHNHTNKTNDNNYESDASSDSNLSHSTAKSIEFNNNKIEKYNNKRKLSTDDEESNSKTKKYDCSSSSSSSDDGVEDLQNTYKCPVCDRNDFDSILVLETHLEDNHPDYPAKCNQCNQICANHKQLTLHKNTVHENSPSKQVSGFGDLTFVDFSSEKFRHIARYECEKNIHKASRGLKFQCKKCSRAFPCANSLEIHEKDCLLNSSMSDDNGLDLSANHISEREIRRNEFFSRLNLQDNSPEKLVPPSGYPQFNETTSNKLRQQLLAKAMSLDSNKDLADIQSIISMTSNGSLLQQLQGKNDKSTLIEEMSKTEQEEESQDVFAVEFRKMKLRGEFPCRLCTAVFPNLRALKGHNRAHLNGNNNGMYRCNMCPHSSIDKGALIRHMRTHNGDRPYECSLCNYAFTTKANCERHLRNRHAKTTREEVKKSIIYHPSEDPTNEDLNKLTGRDEFIRKSGEESNDKIHCTTPKHEMITPTTLIPTLLKESLNVPLEQPTTKLFSKITDIIRSENLKSLKDHRMQNGYLSGTGSSYSFAPKASNVSTPTSAKIHVKSLDELKETSYEQSDEEQQDDEEPIDLVLDLSKKKSDDKKSKSDIHLHPEDLSKKGLINPQLNVNEIFAQQLLKTPPKLDPASAFYATQLALCRQSFPGLTGWPPFPINPLLFQSLQNPLLHQDPEMKERLQRFNLCGGSVINEMKTPAFVGGYKMAEMKTEENFSPKRSINDDIKPLSLNIENNSYSSDTFKLQSPNIQVGQTKQEQQMIQSPNSVKMVIKNGVLMPKQKQRRYRTERPFTCEHCSARFTLRSNMERHIKQQHPQFWSARQRGHVSNVGRKSHHQQQSTQSIKTNYCDLSIPNYEVPKTQQQDFDDTKEHHNSMIDEKLKFALLAQHLRGKNNQHHPEIKRDNNDEDDCALIIDENAEKHELAKTENIDENNQRNCENFEKSRILEDKLKQLHAKQFKNENKSRNEEDLVPVSRLLDNASQQPFKDYFKREHEEPENCGGASEEDEEGLVASGSTSEGNISGTDENKSESETTSSAPVKKKSAYSMAPNRVSCPFCSRKFPWSSSLRRHILTHTGQKPFKCSHCPLLFTTKSNCDRHLLRKHGSNATTISNNDAATNNNNNTNYLMRNVPERPFKCSSCPSSTFSTYSNLKKHISCKHATNAQCDDIRAQGYDAGSSEDEKVVSNDVKRDDWDIPSVALNSTSSAGGKHETSGLVTNSDLPFKCHLCEGSFGDRQDALDHIKDKHYSEYDLLMSKNALDNSATTPDDSGHHDDDESEMRGKFPDYSNRKVICAFCMRRFWSAEDLRRHMRTHTGERPFSCDICRRRFTLKHSMLRHRKKHNVNFDNETANNSDEDNNISSNSIIPTNFSNNNNINHQNKVVGIHTEESDGNEGGGDLISNLLGIRDRSFIDKVLTASADDAAKLLGVKNGAGVKE